MDQSMIRNGKDKKAVRQVERMQEAWKRVLLGGWTAPQIEQICGVSERQVRNMRQVVRVAEEISRRRHAFRERLKEFTGLCAVETPPPERLKTISWQVAKAIRRNEFTGKGDGGRGGSRTRGGAQEQNGTQARQKAACKAGLANLRQEPTEAADGRICQ
jgi:hypothetical protein